MKALAGVDLAAGVCAAAHPSPCRCSSSGLRC